MENYVKACKVSWKTLSAYFYCEQVARFSQKNNGIVLLKIPMKKSNQRAMYPDICEVKYLNIVKNKVVLIDGLECFMINLFKIIKN